MKDEHKGMICCNYQNVAIENYKISGKGKLTKYMWSALSKTVGEVWVCVEDEINRVPLLRIHIFWNVRRRVSGLMCVTTRTFRKETTDFAFPGCWV